MTGVANTRVGAASTGGLLADLSAGRAAPTANDGVFDALFASTLDGTEAASYDVAAREPAERTVSARRDSEPRVGGDDARPVSDRRRTDETEVERETVAERSGVDDADATRDADGEHEGDTSAVDARPVVLPPAMVVRAEQQARAGLSLVGQPAATVPGAATVGGAAEDAGPPAVDPTAAPGATVAPSAGSADQVASSAPQPTVGDSSSSVDVSAPEPGTLALPTDAATPSSAIDGAAPGTAESPADVSAADINSADSSAGMGTTVVADSAPADGSPSEALPVEVPVEVPAAAAELGAVDGDTGGADPGERLVDRGRVAAATSTGHDSRSVSTVMGADGAGRPSTPTGAPGRTDAPPVADPTQRLEDLRRVRERAGLGGVGDSTMSVDLSDEGLGQLTLHALHSRGGLHLTLSAAEQATRDLLMRQGEQLRSDLEAGGLALGSLDIRHSDARSAGGREGDGRGEPARRIDALTGRSSTSPGVTAGGPLRSRPSTDGLDLLI